MIILFENHKSEYLVKNSNWPDIFFVFVFLRGKKKGIHVLLVACKWFRKPIQKIKREKILGVESLKRFLALN